ncbi:hypothetical protein [Acinetobacter baumannii]|uniref:hypothetical protein n=1 Tax=Acinetobacter baumannii TaxID=470 RepID=UPI00044F2662|nr:hypothetical protein [Acinetobacter baumannii]EXD54588.1 hypothetical protein J498_1021 [Acinetobacter baumannii 781407]EXE32167.1 hypothetical protein J564_0404 [Acinetobacter baumannii 1525283]MDO7529602.1 hypothetical protein [Acinetobacter baumannii]OTS66885.1 hypothetical protein CAS98_04675 [Acinetobacter baumannii]TPS69145.1 hypothetical protein FJU46_08935 [Acinetobacter baumannii]
MKLLFQKIQSAFDNQNTHNKITLRNIEALRNLLNQQLPPDILVYSLKNWAGPQQLDIRNYIFWNATIFALVCMALGFLISIYFFPFAILAIFYGFYHRASTAELICLLQDIQTYYYEHTYNFKFATEDSLQKEGTSASDFPLFKLGNQQNSVLTAIHGKWQVRETTHPYKIFRYHYVNREMAYNSKGKWELKDVSYNLYGIILENFPVRGVSISSQQKKACRLGVAWESSDIRFNQKYQQSGINELDLVKFLSPDRLLLLEKMLEGFPGDFYIHPETSALCWLCNVNLLRQQSLYGTSVRELAERLETLSMPEFEQFANILQHFIDETQIPKS